MIMKIETSILNNGIRLIHQRVESSVSHFGVIINTGSRDEDKEEQGIVHFIEHVIFKGTKKRKAYYVISRLEDIGGELNAYTGKEDTAFYASFLNKYYDRTLELISDILCNSVFPEHELEREKEVVIEEINSYKDSPSELIYDDFDELLFDGHPIARNILGTPELVHSFNRENIFDFMKKNYTTDQIVLSSVGNIPFDKILAMSEKYFGSVPVSKRKCERKPFSGYVPGEKVIKKGTFQTHCIIGNLAYNSHDEKRIGMALLNNILGGQSMNSRLNMSLREHNGIAYNVESNYSPYFDTGEFNVYFGTDPEKLEKAITLVKKEFKRLRDNKLGILQMSKARKQIIGQLALSSDDHGELMLSLGKSFLVYNKVDNLKDIYKKIEKITSFQILDIANEILDEKSLSILIYQ